MNRSNNSGTNAANTTFRRSNTLHTLCLFATRLLKLTHRLSRVKIAMGLTATTHRDHHRLWIFLSARTTGLNALLRDSQLEGVVKHDAVLTGHVGLNTSPNAH